MSITMLDPTGRVERAAASEARSPRLDGLAGKRAGFIFNGHYHGVAQFGRVKELLEERYGLAEVVYKLKPNLGAPSPPEIIEEIARRTDFAIVGVCA